MSAALATLEGRLFAEPAGSLCDAGAPPGGRLTLEERLTGALEAARAEGRTDCPVCNGPMVPAAADVPICRDCGSSIR